MNKKWPSEEIMQQRRKDLSNARQRWQKHWAWVWQQKQAKQAGNTARPHTDQEVI